MPFIRNTFTRAWFKELDWCSLVGLSRANGQDKCRDVALSQNTTTFLLPTISCFYNIVDICLGTTCYTTSTGFKYYSKCRGSWILTQLSKCCSSLTWACINDHKFYLNYKIRNKHENKSQQWRSLILCAVNKLSSVQWAKLYVEWAKLYEPDGSLECGEAEMVY